MSEFHPSDEQRLAIDAVGQNYLISAGAGSGKTAVLTQRIHKLVKENQRIDNFLILTFTNLAAGEMKERIRKLLSEDPLTKKFAVEVDNTHIETFDSFYLFLARKYFYVLGIDKDVSVISGPIIEIKQRQILDEIFIRYIMGQDEEMLELIKNTSLKDNEAIKNFILKILKTADSQPDKAAYYSHLENDFGDDKFALSIINRLYHSLIDNINFLINKVKKANLESLEDESQILDYLEDLLSHSDYTSLAESISNNSFPVKPRNGYEDSSTRDSLANFYNKYIKGKCFTVDEIKDIVINNQKFVPLVIKIVKEVDNRVDEFKKSHNAYSFPDISRMVLNLFKNPDIVKEVSNQFDYIMVDEYQDTNDIQETVLNIIGRNNVYMVGDIKQSIYRFRNADCKIFDAKFNAFKKHIGGEEIDLNQSFRSRREVVDYINDVFSRIMTKQNNTIDYKNGHEFIFGQTKYGDKNKRYRVEEYHYEFEKAEECAEKEAQMIAKDIINKVNNHFEVFDLNNNISRPVNFSDFAIIVDRETNFDAFRKEFSNRGIPLKSCGKEKLMTADIIVVLKSLLKMLYFALNSDYGEEYKHSFISVARSFLIEMSDQEILDTFANKDIHKVLLTDLAQRIELIKERLRFTSLYEILNALYQKFEIYDHIAKITNFYANAHKAEILLDYAKQMDNLSLSLKDLVDYFDNLSNYDLDIDYRDNDTQDNSVTLINIHQSKGLEYNIVYYPLLNKQFNSTSHQGEFFVSKKYGLIFPNNKELLKGLHVKQEKTEEVEEKIRLLYVALTRAKQKIVLVVGKKANAKPSIKIPSDCNNLFEVYSLSGVEDKYVCDFELNNKEVKLSEKIEEVKNVKPIELRSISIPSELIKKEKASKEVNKVSEETLLFGTQIHAILEGLDFSNRDLSKYRNPQFRKVVENVFTSPLFKGVTNEMVKPEFAYFDEVNNVHGVIDCLVEKDNEILIIDYKLKNIADEEYEKQLRTYAKYVSSISDKPIKMYLLAALTGELKEVKNV